MVEQAKDPRDLPYEMPTTIVEAVDNQSLTIDEALKIRVRGGEVIIDGDSGLLSGVQIVSSDGEQSPN